MPAKALCWKFMILSSDKKKAECTICKHQFSVSHRSTTNLNRHLETKHPFELEAEKEKCLSAKPSATPDQPALVFQPIAEIPGPSTSTSSSQKIQPTMVETLERITKYKVGSSKKRHLDERVLDLVVMDMQPLSVVEDRGFRRLVEALDPRYDIVSRKRLSSQLLPEKYNSMKTRVIEELRSVAHVSLTTDCWTSRANEAYTTITCHYINDDWELRAPVLLTRSEGKRHTSENLASELRSAIEEFYISDKVTTIVTDNARNIVNAVEALNIRHVPCFAHTLNLIIKHAVIDVAEVAAVVKKIKAIITFFHSSTVATNSLRDIFSGKNEAMRKMKQDVETRWNSTYEMMESYLSQHEEVTTVLCLSGET
ncbi:zinc finger BED domain-containing protein 1 [Elysia marginata]|uniref:Zinc finger BED domain-containing protein 1 n=1 Tax=Elysia marginata TaxID=1093978 RepID=A0AAV4EJ16_9GAST|nr:zinc finger BED domain-containing protein 1 [Elysia marginata]